MKFKIKNSHAENAAPVKLGQAARRERAEKSKGKIKSSHAAPVKLGQANAEKIKTIYKENLVRL
jgi:hypothetical protein